MSRGFLRKLAEKQKPSHRKGLRGCKKSNLQLNNSRQPDKISYARPFWAGFIFIRNKLIDELAESTAKKFRKG